MRRRSALYECFLVTFAKEGYIFIVVGLFVCLFVCLSVCLSVCLLATLRKKLCTDLDEIFRVCWKWDSEQVIKFWE